MKKYILIAGVNGAGKSTLYHSFEYLQNMPRINLDDEVRKIGNWRNQRDVFNAGLTTTEKLKRLLEGEQSFNQETTLCGNAILAHLKKAMQNGFFIEIHYIGLDSADIAKERVAYRVNVGGHGIPEEDIERRYRESFRRISEFLPMADRVIFYDNSTEFRRFAVYEKGELKAESALLPKWYIEFVK